MYIRRLKTMSVSFEFCIVQKMTNKLALLNSGATENFLDKSVWRRLQVERIKLPKPLTMHNINETKNCIGKIKSYC